MLIGIKYCGGCRASFDRLAETEAVKAAFEVPALLVGSVVFENAIPGGRYDFLLAVCGCKAVCPDLSVYHFDHLAIMDEADAAREVVKEIQNRRAVTSV